MGLLFLMCSFPWKGGSARQDPETARALQREEAEGGPSSLSLGPSCLIQLDFRARFPLNWASVPPLSIGCALGPDIPGRQRCLRHAPLHPLAPRPARLRLRSRTWVRSALSLLWASVPRTFTLPLAAWASSDPEECEGASMELGAHCELPHTHHFPGPSPGIASPAGRFQSWLGLSGPRTPPPSWAENC